MGSKLCGRRSTQNGKRGQRPNCPSGSVNVQARRPENQSLLKMTKKEEQKHQQRLRKKKRKKKKRNKNLHSLPHPTTDVENLYILQVFQKYFFLVSIALSLQTMKTNMKSGNKYNLKTGQIYIKNLC